jgi:hypothetical protein
VTQGSKGTVPPGELATVLAGTFPAVVGVEFEEIVLYPRD